MTVSTSTCMVTYPGSGTTGPFSFSFRILTYSDILVTKISSGGTRTVLTFPIDYSYSLTDNGYSGGSITLSSSLAVGYTLLIERSTPITQEAAFRNNVSFDAGSHELAFDKDILIGQELSALVERSLKFRPESFSSEIFVETPSNGYFPVYNSSTSTYQNSSATASDIITASGVSTGLGNVLARYTSGGLVTSGTTALTMIFNTETTDSNSEHNTSTGLFTAAKTGKYSVSVNMIGAGSVNGDMFKLMATLSTGTSYSVTHVIAKQGFQESFAALTLPCLSLNSATTISITITRLAGTGTFTPCQTDGTLYPTLTIKQIG